MWLVSWYKLYGNVLTQRLNCSNIATDLDYDIMSQRFGRSKVSAVKYGECGTLCTVEPISIDYLSISHLHFSDYIIILFQQGHLSFVPFPHWALIARSMAWSSRIFASRSGYFLLNRQ
jgi:hypothetical protein